MVKKSGFFSSKKNPLHPHLPERLYKCLAQFGVFLKEFCRVKEGEEYIQLCVRDIEIRGSQARSAACLILGEDAYIFMHERTFCSKLDSARNTAIVVENIIERLKKIYPELNVPEPEQPGGRIRLS